jgi:hypothetical protein
MRPHLLRGWCGSRAWGRLRRWRDVDVDGVVLGVLASQHGSSKQRFGFLCQLVCRVGGDVGGSVVLEATWKAPEGSCRIPMACARSGCSPTHATPSSTPADRVIHRRGRHPRPEPGRELARIWTAGPGRALTESDLKRTIRARSQCYEPKSALVVRGRIELPTPRFSGEPGCPNRANMHESGELAVVESVGGRHDLA